MPCPTGVNIPFNFDFFNYAQMYDDLAGARFQYQVFLAEAERSGACIACGTCEQLCPQQIEIVQWMPKVTELLS
jgi:predicted aldo/keto reductase-like oxidoreductase